MVNRRKEQIDWCCKELKSMTSVQPHGGGRTWNWPPHIAELAWGKFRLMCVQHEPNETIANAVEPDRLGDELDLTFRYCPFCGSDTTRLVDDD